MKGMKMTHELHSLCVLFFAFSSSPLPTPPQAFPKMAQMDARSSVKDLTQIVAVVHSKVSYDVEIGA